ncbi:3420_t:CDS:1, partial [Funneliformis geosporum]
IERLKELINKPPLTLTDENIQAELVRSQELIIKLEKELAASNLGEPIENIIQIDEKLLHENETLKVNLNKQVNNYQELAQERNKLVFQEIKNINVEKLREVLPQVSREVIEKHLASAQNYTELASARNNLLVESIKSSKQEVPM